MPALLRDAVIRLSNTRLFSAAVSVLERCVPELHRLRVLMYHRIDRPERRPDLYPGLIGPTPDAFARQMDFVANHYHAVSMNDLLESQRSGQPLPPRAVLLTFDDATEDFAEFAWPVLRDRKLPVTLFVPTAFPDNPHEHFWWDRLYRAVMHAPAEVEWRLPWGTVAVGSTSQREGLFRQFKEQLKQVAFPDFQAAMQEISKTPGVSDPANNGVLSWHQLNVLHQQGVTLAPHTRHHWMLNRIPLDELRAEMEGSWNDLAARFGSEVPRVIAYPAGGVNAQVLQVAREQNFSLAFTTKRGANRWPIRSPLELHRINVGARTHLGLLRVQLAYSAG